jgi:hypothetical protein
MRIMIRNHAAFPALFVAANVRCKRLVRNPIVYPAKGQSPSTEEG